MRKVSAEEVLNDIYFDDISAEARELAKRYGYLPYMVQRYIDMLGIEETKELLQTFEELRPYPVIRCNYLRIDCGELVRELNAMGFDFEPLEWCNYCYRVVSQPSSPTIGATHQYFKGYYFVYRDASPTIPPIVQAPKAGDIVLDMCAAPGGKATHLLQLMEDRGLLIANDKALSRIPALLSHLYRMGFKSFIVINDDGRNLPRYLANTFDSVLVDAPCSAEGGIMFDPSRKTRTSINDLAKLVAREIELLAAGIELAKPGGVIVYSTCSIAPEENEYVIMRILEMYKGIVRVESIDIPGSWSPGLRQFRNLEFPRDVTNCIRVWPHRHRMEGFFVCKLRKLR